MTVWGSIWVMGSGIQCTSRKEWSRVVAFHPCYLFIASLGVALDSTKLGVELGGTILTALFFADDLLLLSRTPKHGMNSLLRVVSQFCKDMKMTLSTSKTYILTNSRNQGSWKVEEETIEEILVAKYMGVNIQVRGRSMVGKYESDIIRRATNCAFTIMNLTRGHWLLDAYGMLVPYHQ